MNIISKDELSKYIGKKIRYYREKQGLSQIDLADKLGVDRVSVTRYESGARKVNQDMLFTLADLLHINIDDLFPNTVSETKKSENIMSIYNQLDIKRQHKVYDYAQSQLDEQSGKSITVGRATAAGNPLCGETQDSEEQHIIINRDEIPRGADEVLTIAGDSMEPLLPEGSQQFIHYQPVPDTDGQVMIVSIKDEGVTCKKVYREKDKIRLVSINKKYNDMIYPAEEIKCIGKVILNK